MTLQPVVGPQPRRTDRWAFATGDWHYLPDNPLPRLTGRSFTARLVGNSEASFTIDANLPEVANLETGVSPSIDLWITRNAKTMFRGRIGAVADSADGTTHTVTCSAADYRAALSRRILYDSDTVTWTNVDQSQVAWNLINQTQGKTGGNWGIVRGAGQTTGTLVSPTFQVGSTVEENIVQLANNGSSSFDWDINPASTPNSTALTFDVYPGQRGVDRGVELTFPGRIQAWTRQEDPSVFANALRATGGTPSGGSTLAAVSVASSTISTDPAGRFDGQFADTTILTAAALTVAAQKQLAAGQVVTPAYTVKLKPEGVDDNGVWQSGWGGPSEMWVGDPVTLVIQSGYRSFTISLRIFELKCDLSDESDAATVTLTLGAIPPTRKWLYRSTEKRLRRLERKGP